MNVQFVLLNFIVMTFVSLVMGTHITLLVYNGIVGIHGNVLLAIMGKNLTLIGWCRIDFVLLLPIHCPNYKEEKEH